VEEGYLEGVSRSPQNAWRLEELAAHPSAPEDLQPGRNPHKDVEAKIFPQALLSIPWLSSPFSHSKAAVRAVQAMNRICVLDVDLQGVRNIKKTDLHPIYISVQPPSLDVLVGALGGGVGWVGPKTADPRKACFVGAETSTAQH
jgi:hypothetical protein